MNSAINIFESYKTNTRNKRLPADSKTSNLIDFGGIPKVCNSKANCKLLKNLRFKGCKQFSLELFVLIDN